MNFQSMTYFLTLVEERNFTRAAERLHVTQQTLSGHIAAVERGGDEALHPSCAARADGWGRGILSLRAYFPAQ